jgi:hypothetical protein
MFCLEQVTSSTCTVRAHGIVTKPLRSRHWKTISLGLSHYAFALAFVEPEPNRWLETYPLRPVLWVSKAPQPRCSTLARDLRFPAARSQEDLRESELGKNGARQDFTEQAEPLCAAGKIELVSRT